MRSYIPGSVSANGSISIVGNPAVETEIPLARLNGNGNLLAVVNNKVIMQRSGLIRLAIHVDYVNAVAGSFAHVQAYLNNALLLRASAPMSQTGGAYGGGSYQTQLVKAGDYLRLTGWHTENSATPRGVYGLLNIEEMVI